MDIETIPFIGMIVTPLLWFVVQTILLTGEKKVFAARVEAGFLIAFTGLAVWGIVLASGSNQGITITSNWIQLSRQTSIPMALEFRTMNLMMLILLPVIVALNLSKSGKLLKATESLCLPVLLLGTTVSMAATNFYIFLIGMSVTLLSTFIILFGDQSETAQKGRSAFRYMLFMVLSLALIAFGILGLAESNPEVEFAKLTHASGDTVWILPTLFSGLLIFGFQIPFLGGSTALSSVPRLASTVIPVGHMLTIGTLLSRLAPALDPGLSMAVVGVVLSLSAMMIALQIIREIDSSKTLGWITTYMISGTMLPATMGLGTGALQAAFSGTLAILLFDASSDTFKSGYIKLKPLLFLGALALMGVPMTGVGYSKLIEYNALLSVSTADEALRNAQYAFGFLKIIADLIFVAAIWGVVIKTTRNAPGREKKPDGKVIARLAAISLSVISFLAGGKLFSGLVPEVEAEIAPQMQWLITFLGQKLDVTGNPVAIGIHIAVLIVGPLLAHAWLFKNEAAETGTARSVGMFLDKLHLPNSTDVIVWKKILRPVSKHLGFAFHWFDDRFKQLFEKISRKGYELKSRLVHRFDNEFISNTLIEGLTEMFETISKSVKVFQTGNVHYYMGVSLFIFGIMILRLLLGGL